MARPNIPKQNLAGPTTPVFVSQGGTPTKGVGGQGNMSAWRMMGKMPPTQPSTINTAKTAGAPSTTHKGTWPAKGQ